MRKFTIALLTPASQMPPSTDPMMDNVNKERRFGGHRSEGGTSANAFVGAQPNVGGTLSFEFANLHDLEVAESVIRTIKANYIAGEAAPTGQGTTQG